MKTTVHGKINLRAIFGNSNPKKPSFIKNSDWQYRWYSDLKQRSREGRKIEAFNPNPYG